MVNRIVSVDADTLLFPIEVRNVMTFPTAVAMSYDGDGNITEVVEDGVTTAYTWNVDGTVATDTRNGVTRRYTWDVDGNLTGIVAT